MTSPFSPRRFKQTEREELLQRLLLNARSVAQADRESFLIPDKRAQPWSPLLFLNELPKVAEVAVVARYGVKGFLILHGRLLRSHNRLRLQEIGAKLGVTREWVRTVENQILGMFAQIFFLDHYVTAKFRIREQFLLPLRDLEEKIRNFRYSTFTVSDWARSLQRIWCLHPRDLGEVEPLVRGILNYPFLGDTRLSKVPRFSFSPPKKRF